MMDFKGLKYLVVGAGFFGSVIAERIASDNNEEVMVIDQYPHIGGLCFSAVDVETGIEFHKYGTHIFHTSNKKVWKYINSFTDFNGYRHQVLSTYKNKVYQMPINLETINSFYGVNLRPYEVDAFLKAETAKEKIVNPQNLEEKAISLIGRPLYEAFIKEYTEKQWQKDCDQLPSSIIERLPVRNNYDENYFFDPWQGIPLEGYTTIFTRLLSHKNIKVYLNVDFFDIKDQLPSSCLIVYSGPIDRFFEYKFGRFDWITLEFEKEIIDVEDFQGTSVMNYPEHSIPYIRIHEPRHYHPERNYPKQKTLIFKEYPKKDNGSNPYYPVNSHENQEMLQKYKEERKECSNIIFGGRLGDYKYYNMDQVIASALDTYENKIKKRNAYDCPGTVK
jgi:UDP-galactopyranose mutase